MNEREIANSQTVRGLSFDDFIITEDDGLPPKISPGQYTVLGQRPRMGRCR